MANHSDNSSSEDTGFFPGKSEAQLRILEEGAVRLLEEVTERDVTKMRLAARSLSRDSSVSGHRVVSGITGGLENLLGTLPANAAGAVSKVVSVLLQGIEALRLLSEEFSSPAGLKAEIDAFALNFQSTVASMKNGGRGLSGTEMAA